MQLGHFHDQAVKDLVKNDVISSTCKSINDWEACLMGKSHALPHKSSNKTYNLPLELVFVDIWGAALMVLSEGTNTILTLSLHQAITIGGDI